MAVRSGRPPFPMGQGIEHHWPPPARQEQAVSRGYLTQEEINELPDGTRVEVRWPGRDWSGMLQTRRRLLADVLTVWAVSVPNGYAVGPLNRVGAPGSGLTTVRIAGDSDD